MHDPRLLQQVQPSRELSTKSGYYSYIMTGHQACSSVFSTGPAREREGNAVEFQSQPNELIAMLYSLALRVNYLVYVIYVCEAVASVESPNEPDDGGRQIETENMAISLAQSLLSIFCHRSADTRDADYALPQ